MALTQQIWDHGYFVFAVPTARVGSLIRSIGAGFPRISHISAYAAHQGGLVLWYGLGRPVITPK